MKNQWESVVFGALVLLGPLPLACYAQEIKPIVDERGYVRRGIRPDQPEAAYVPRFDLEVSAKTDPDVERLLQDAERYADAKQYDLAATLAQKVLDSRAGLLAPEAGAPREGENFRRYSSTQQAMEQLLAGLPAEGRSAYRAAADVEAAKLLAIQDKNQREQALSQVVDRLFISSHGDDAAYELSGLLLDRHHNVAANRLLNQVLNAHPDPSVPRDQVLLRLVVASEGIGDLQTAKRALAELESISTPERAAWRDQLTALRAKAKAAPAPQIASEGKPRDWVMALGTPARDGHMPSLSEPLLRGPLEVAWSESFPLPNGSDAGASPTPTPGWPRYKDIDRAGIVDHWLTHGWTPVRQLLLHDGKAYFYAYDMPGPRQTTICCRIDPAAQEGQSDERSPSRPSIAFKTPPSDSQTSSLVPWLSLYEGLPGWRAEWPATCEEFCAFTDRTSKSMAICGDTLYVLEGAEGGTPPKTLERAKIPQVGTLDNTLAAYDATSGKRKPWEKNAWMGLTQFVCAPVACGDHLVIAGREIGSLYLYAVSPASGELIWKIRLCEEPLVRSLTWLPAGLAVDGNEVYVATGCGFVIAVDGASGSTRWAVQYKRSLGNAFGRITNPQYEFLRGLDVKGWDENVVICHGRSLIVLPTDAEAIFAFDRRDGSFLWQSPQNSDLERGGPARYCLGVLNDGLFVAGPAMVRRLKTAGGAVVWERRLGSAASPDQPAARLRSFGRGALTDNAIYLPVGTEVLQLDPATGRPVAQVPVNLPPVPRHDGDSHLREPIGNLYSDGKHLLVAGFDRVYLLKDARSPPIAEKKEDDQ